MNYHTITYPDQNNGDGLRVALWLSGCNHHCKGCQNSQTWDINSGILFDESAKQELFRELDKDYISGLTLTGGDPLYESNLKNVLNIVSEFNKQYQKSQDNENRSLSPKKTIWLYTGYTWEEIFGLQTILNGSKIANIDTEGNITLSGTALELTHLRQQIVSQCDVLVDGQYIDSKRDITLKWRGSSNQRVIDVQKSLQQNQVVLYCE